MEEALNLSSDKLLDDDENIPFLLDSLLYFVFHVVATTSSAAPHLKSFHGFSDCPRPKCPKFQHHTKLCSECSISLLFSYIFSVETLTLSPWSTEWVSSLCPVCFVLRGSVSHL